MTIIAWVFLISLVIVFILGSWIIGSIGKEASSWQNLYLKQSRQNKDLAIKYNQLADDYNNLINKKPILSYQIDSKDTKKFNDLLVLANDPGATQGEKANAAIALAKILGKRI